MENVNQLQSKAARELALAVTGWLEEATEDTEKECRFSQALDEQFWETLRLFENVSFYTAKGLEFTYYMKGNELFVSRKDKSLTRSTGLLAFHTALLLQKDGRKVSGPKKLGTFGASYLFPVFLALGVIRT